MKNKIKEIAERLHGLSAEAMTVAHTGKFTTLEAEQFQNELEEIGRQFLYIVGEHNKELNCYEGCQHIVKKQKIKKA